MAKYTLLVGLMLTLFTILPRTVHACSCVKPDVPQAFREAQAVFQGEVTEIVSPRTDNPKAALRDRLFRIKFKVEHHWKGAIGTEVVVLSDQGRAGCFSWGPFIKGRKYLVYAERKTPAGARIRDLAVLFSCNRTDVLANLSRDLKVLNHLRDRGGE